MVRRGTSTKAPKKGLLHPQDFLSRDSTAPKKGLLHPQDFLSRDSTAPCPHLILIVHHLALTSSYFFSTMLPLPRCTSFSPCCPYLVVLLFHHVELSFQQLPLAQGVQAHSTVQPGPCV